MGTHPPANERKAIRSALMGRIRAQNTTPELLLRKALWREGLRYRLNCQGLVGRPDIVFLGPRLVVFVDGCFWHGCPEHYVRPRSRTSFWAKKLRGNVERDRDQTLKLEGQGWRVMRVWEHEVFTGLSKIVGEIRLCARDSAVSPEREIAAWRVVAVEPLDARGEAERRVLVQLRDHAVQRTIQAKRHTKKW